VCAGVAPVACDWMTLIALGYSCAFINGGAAYSWRPGGNASRLSTLLSFAATRPYYQSLCRAVNDCHVSTQGPHAPNALKFVMSKFDFIRMSGLRALLSNVLTSNFLEA